MPLPTPLWAAGQKITAAQLQQLSDAYTNGFLSVYKPADTSRATNVTLANDPDLTLTVLASTNYLVTASINYTAGATGDGKFAWTWPTGAQFPWSIIANTTANAFQAIAFDNSVSSGTPFVVGGNGSANVLTAYITGYLSVGVTAGQLRFQWAQNTSDGTATVVKAGSWIQAKIA